MHYGYRNLQAKLLTKGALGRTHRHVHCSWTLKRRIYIYIYLLQCFFTYGLLGTGVMIYLWWGLCTLILLTWLVREAVGDSDPCCCVHVTDYFRVCCFFAKGNCSPMPTSSLKNASVILEFLWWFKNIQLFVLCLTCLHDYIVCGLCTHVIFTSTATVVWISSITR